jgi:DNA-binding MarR family transcriptional regulator
VERATGEENGLAPRPALAGEIERLFQAVFAMKGSPPEILPAHQDLTMGQFRALLVLARAEPLGVGALGERLGVGLPAASRMIDRLVQDGLAERWDDPNDRRRTLVRLTAHGRDSMEQLHQGREHMRNRLLDLMSQLAADDLAALRAGMRALVDVAERQSEPA